MADPIIVLIVFSLLAMLFILFRPRRAKYVRRTTRSFNGRGHDEAQKLH